MGKRLAALLLSLCLLMGTASARDAFSVEDLCVDDWMVGTPQDVLRETFGAPEGENVEEKNGISYTTLTYDGIELTYTEEGLCGARWTNDTVAGPRGLHVGDEEASVRKAFRDDGLDGDVLYTSGTVGDFGRQLPPCGVIESDETGERTYYYLAPLAAYDADMRPEDFVSRTHAMLWLRMESEHVAEIRWAVGLPSE